MRSLRRWACDPSIGGVVAGTMGVWAEPFTKLRLQKIFNLMQDPYERADFTSNTYWDWNHDEIRAAQKAAQRR